MSSTHSGPTTNDGEKPPKAAKRSAPTMSSLTDQSNVALRHIARFMIGRQIGLMECLTVRLARVARAATVELAAARYGISVDPAPGCVWLLVVQEGLAGQGGVGHAVNEYHGLLVDSNCRACGC